MADDKREEEQSKENPNLYTKAQQEDVLAQHGYNEEQLKELKTKEERAEAILNLQSQTGDVYTSRIGTAPTVKSKMRYSPYQQDSIQYTKLNKPRQVEMLDSLGLSKKEIRALKYEADRVEKLLELMKDD